MFILYHVYLSTLDFPKVFPVRGDASSALGSDHDWDAPKVWAQEIGSFVNCDLDSFFVFCFCFLLCKDYVEFISILIHIYKEKHM